MKRLLAILGLSILHYIVATVALASSFTSSMRQFDDGIAKTSTEASTDTLTDILYFPASFIFDMLPFHNVAVDWTLSILNSLLWGCALYYLLRLLSQKNGARKRDIAGESSPSGPSRTHDW